MSRRVGQEGLVRETVQEPIFQTLSVYFIIYFMLGLACLVVPGGEFLRQHTMFDSCAHFWIEQFMGHVKSKAF